VISAKRLHGYLLTGDLDQQQDMFAQIERLLHACQVSYQRETRPDLDHDFPSDFDQSLDKAMQFIFRK
jgi:hypothetical protein